MFGDLICLRFARMSKKHSDPWALKCNAYMAVVVIIKHNIKQIHNFLPHNLLIKIIWSSSLWEFVRIHAFVLNTKTWNRIVFPFIIGESSFLHMYFYLFFLNLWQLMHCECVKTWKCIVLFILAALKKFNRKPNVSVEACGIFTYFMIYMCACVYAAFIHSPGHVGWVPFRWTEVPLMARHESRRWRDGSRGRKGPAIGQCDAGWCWDTGYPLVLSQRQPCDGPWPASLAEMWFW